MAYCSQCGAPMPEGDLFCHVCGMRQITRNMTQQAARQPQQGYQAQQGYQTPQGYPTQPNHQPPQSYPAQQNYGQPAQQFTPPTPGYPQHKGYVPPPQQPPYQPMNFPYSANQPMNSSRAPSLQPTQAYGGGGGSAGGRGGHSAAGAAGRAAAKAAKGGASAAKWIFSLLAVVMMVVVVVVVVNGGGFTPKTDEELIRERIEAFEQAYNDGDYDGILDCLDSGMRAATEISMGLMDNLMGEMIGFDIGMSDMFGLAGLMGDFCEIEIKNIAISGDTATVDIVMNLNMYGESASEATTLPMVKQGRKWLIGGGIEDLLNMY